MALFGGERSKKAHPQKHRLLAWSRCGVNQRVMRSVIHIVDRGVVHMQSPFEHHFLQFAIAERVAQVPTHAEQNNLSFEVTLFEGGAIVHEVGSSPSPQ